MNGYLRWPWRQKQESPHKMEALHIYIQILLGMNENSTGPEGPAAASPCMQIVALEGKGTRRTDPLDSAVTSAMAAFPAHLQGL